MGTITWSAGTSADWDVSADWSSGTTPGPSDNVKITADPADNSPYTVTINAQERFQADTVVLNQAEAGLDVAGTLAVVGQLALNSQIGLRLGGATPGTVMAESVINDTDVSGSGAIEVAGTFVNAHVVSAASGQTLTIVAGTFVNLAIGSSIAGLDALGGTIVLQSAGSADPLINLQGGTLVGGIYEAGFGGALILPENSTITTDAAFIELSQSGSTIQSLNNRTGFSRPLESTLETIAPSGELSVQNGYRYETSNCITDCGVLSLVGGDIAPAGLAVTSSGTLIGSGTVSGEINSDGIIIASPEILGIAQQQTLDVLAIDGSVVGSGSMQIQNGALLQLTTATTVDLSFSSVGGASRLAAGLELGGGPNLGSASITYGGTISGFSRTSITQLSDTIYLPDINPNYVGYSYEGDTSGGVLRLSEGTDNVVDLHFAGDYTEGSFLISSDPSGVGTDVTEAPCFVTGTHIRTARGEVPVEFLRAKDLVVAQSGDLFPVIWIGKARVDCRRHPKPKLVWPVLIAAGAFADNEPCLDLWLSPDHAVFFGGVLIPIKHLINGSTVAQVPTDTVTYWHVELAAHTVIFAEGLASESYLDTGNRAQFVNGATYIALHPDFSARSWENACAPLCTKGSALVKAKSQLRDRLLETNGLKVRSRGRAIRPAVVAGRLFRFVLPAETDELEILSPRLPVLSELSQGYTRGVCISGIVINGRVLDLDHPAIGRGFHPTERSERESWRWTDGAARLTLSTFGLRSVPVILDLLLRQAISSQPRRALASA